MLASATAATRFETNSGSQASFAFNTIRADILCGRHMPNKKLKVHELADTLGVSPGAVREALFRLISEHLVEARDQRGFAVTAVSISELQELTDLRCEIEAIVCRRSVERGDIEWEGGLIAAQHRFRAASAPFAEDGEVTLEFLTAHSVFHQALSAAAGNSRLLAIRAQLYEQYQRFRAYYGHFAGKRHVAGDHDRLVELALARDADALVETMIDHVSSTTRRIIQAMSEA